MAMIYQSPELPKEAIDGATAMNIAVNDEVQKQRQNLLDAAREQAYLQDPTLKYVPRELAKGLIADKMDWQKAYEAGDPQGMAAAALNAQSRRERAQAIGWNPAAYGENVSLVEAAQNLANNDTRALNDIFYNLKNTGRTYTQDIADYLDQGYSIDSAKRLAGQNAEYNTQDNMNSLVDAFHMYGTDPRGAINANGLRILGQMAQAGGASPSELANFYAQMQASPKDSWNFENSLITAQNADRFARGRQVLAGQISQAQQERGFQHDADMANLRAELDVKKAAAVAQIQEQTKQMGREQAYNYALKVLVNAGYSPQEAAMMAATAVTGRAPGKTGGSGGNGSNNGNGGMKISDANTIINQWRNWNEDNPDASPEANPFNDAYEEAKATMNGYTDRPADVNNYNNVNSWAQNILEENFRRGYPLSADDLHKVISSVGGYGEQVANELEKSGALKKYGK